MNNQQENSSVKTWLNQSLPAVALYVLATVLTSAHFLADTADYVESIVLYEANQHYLFWEIGHVLWRPAGWLLLHATFPLSSRIVGPDLRLNATLDLLVVNWIAGLVSVLALSGIVREFSNRRWVLYLTVIGFILSHGFLNYSQAGAPYTPGLALILTAFYVLIKHRDNERQWLRTGILAGLALGGAICFWLTNIVVIPAVLAIPVLLSTSTLIQKARLVFCTAVSLGAIVAVIYLAVLVGGLGIRSVSGLRAWMAPSTVGTAQDKSVSRTIFGFARSLIYMGNDGVFFKRYLVKDPFNPVSVFDLLRLGVWKLALFYLFLLSILINLWQSTTGKKILATLLVNAIPVLALALYWQGGDIERYLALYPILFLSLAYSLSSDRSFKSLKYLSIAFVIAAAVTNAWAMSNYVSNREQRQVTDRLKDLQPKLKPESRVFTVNLQDELYNFFKSFPFNPMNQTGSFNADALMAAGSVEAPQWPSTFSRKADRIWSLGGDVWVSNRVMSARPKAEWSWVEGDDKRLSWMTLHSFFSHLEVGPLVGGEDGFILVLPSEANKEQLRSYSSRSDD